MSIEHIIVAATGIGYATVGTLRMAKGDINNGLIWCGYALAQIGLYRNIPS